MAAAFLLIGLAALQGVQATAYPGPGLGGMGGGEDAALAEDLEDLLDPFIELILEPRDIGPTPLMPECSDGVNNDVWEDSIADWPWDPGCTDALDPSEWGYIAPPECSDFFDNNGNDLMDVDDPACWTDPTNPTTYDPSIPLETRPACSDFADNDGNTKLDAADPGCWTDPTNPTTYDPNDDEERTPECFDTLDNDGNGLADASDPGCWTDSMDPKTYSATDTVEASTECSDNVDNNGNGKVDRLDSECWTNPNDPTTYDPADVYEGTEPCGSNTIRIKGAPSQHGADFDGEVFITLTLGAFRTLESGWVKQTGGFDGGPMPDTGEVKRHRTVGSTHTWSVYAYDYQIREFTYHFETGCPAAHSGSAALAEDLPPEFTCEAIPGDDNDSEPGDDDGGEECDGEDDFDVWN